MSTTITPVASWDAITAPTDGEVATSADIIARFIQPLANRDAYLGQSISAEVAARMSAISTVQNAIGSEANARSQDDASLQGQINAEETTRGEADAALYGLITRVAGGGGFWSGVTGRCAIKSGFIENNVSASPANFYEQSSLSAAFATFSIGDLLPAGTTIVNITALLRGSDSATALPATLPKVQLNQLHVTDPEGTATALAETTWEPSSLLVYQTATRVTLTPASPITVADNCLYYVTVTGAAGTDSTVGLRIYGIRVVLGVGS